MAIGPKNKRDQLLLIVAMLSLGLAGVYWQYVYSPRGTDLTTERERVESLERANAKARTELARGSVKDLQVEAAAYARNLELMRQLVPTSNEVPALLEQVSTAGRRVGLDLSSVQPEPVVEGDQFDTYRYKLAVIGDYHALAEFLANIGSLPRIIAPINVSVVPFTGQATGPTQRAGAAKLDCRFEIQTYVAKTAPRAASSAAGRKS
jgi:type IV pilus assembly protein PilO